MRSCCPSGACATSESEISSLIGTSSVTLKRCIENRCNPECLRKGRATNVNGECSPSELSIRRLQPHSQGHRDISMRIIWRLRGLEGRVLTTGVCDLVHCFDRLLLPLVSVGFRLLRNCYQVPRLRQNSAGNFFHNRTHAHDSGDYATLPNRA